MDTNIPLHIGYIVDGNRRWAKLNGISKDVHRRGKDVVFDVAEKTFESGVKYASFYIFSTENWKRSSEEVSYLMNLFVEALRKESHRLIDNNIKLIFLGSRSGVDPKILAAMDDVESQTANCTGGTICLCFNYGGYEEVAAATAAIVASGVKSEDVTPELITEHIYHPEIPPVDIVVRTGGELRISNFMLWRVAYSEFLFIDKLWPDMTDQDVTFVLEEYAKRSRRFGQ